MCKINASKACTILPQNSAAEATLVKEAIIYPANSLLEVCAHLSGRTALTQLQASNLHIEVPALSEDELTKASVSECSQAIRLRVEQARAIQINRQGKPNNLLGTKEIEQYCVTDEAGMQLLNKPSAD